VAASRIAPPVAAVVNVSSPTDLSGLDGVAAASRLTVPLLSIAGASDEYVSNVRAVSAAAVRAPVNQLLIVPGSGADGVNLLDPSSEPTAARTRAAIEAFLAAQLT
jgi:alpha-beta hydrolase superfamily lysophospholipase